MTAALSGLDRHSDHRDRGSGAAVRTVGNAHCRQAAQQIVLVIFSAMEVNEDKADLPCGRMRPLDGPCILEALFGPAAEVEADGPIGFDMQVRDLPARRNDIQRAADRCLVRSQDVQGQVCRVGCVGQSVAHDTAPSAEEAGLQVGDPVTSDLSRRSPAQRRRRCATR